MTTYRYGDDRVSVIEILDNGQEKRIPWAEPPAEGASPEAWAYYQPIGDDPDYQRVRAAFEAGAITIGDPPPLPSPVPVPRQVAMWRARTIMKVTPWGAGTLFDAVMAFIASMTDPLQKAAAEEALERGTIYDRDGVFVPIIAAGVGIDEPTHEKLIIQAVALPA